MEYFQRVKVPYKVMTYIALFFSDGGYYPHFVDLHIPWILSAFCGYIYILWILSAFCGYHEYICILWISFVLVLLRST